MNRLRLISSVILINAWHPQNVFNVLKLVGSNKWALWIKHTAELKSLLPLTSKSVSFKAECLPAIAVMANAAFRNLPQCCKQSLRCYKRKIFNFLFKGAPGPFYHPLEDDCKHFLHPMYYMCECMIKDVSCDIFLLETRTESFCHCIVLLEIVSSYQVLTSCSMIQLTHDWFTGVSTSHMLIYLINQMKYVI